MTTLEVSIADRLYQSRGKRSAFKEWTILEVLDLSDDERVEVLLLDLIDAKCDIRRLFDRVRALEEHE